MSDKNEDVICCGVVEALKDKGYYYPFERPIIINKDTLNLEVGGVALRVCKKTPTGKISQTKQSSIFIKFCPFCGKSLNNKGGKEELENDRPDDE